MAKTACVLLNYRNPEEILPLIESIRKCDWPEKEIYVVENGTGPEAVRFLADIVGADNVISTPVNLGFAGGMNLGIKAAMDRGAEFLWLLSKDITVEPDCLKQLHSLWPRLTRPGFLGSLMDYNGTERVYFVNGEIDRHGRVRDSNNGRTIDQFPELKAEYGLTDYVSGSCVFTHRSVIEKVGLIPEEYFLYYEDCEWSLNTKRAGFINYVAYRSRLHHRKTVGEFNRSAQFYCRRNAYHFKKRNGYARPWTKFFELLRVRKGALKAKWLGNSQMLEILQAVETHIRDEKLGVGPWR